MRYGFRYVDDEQDAGLRADHLLPVLSGAMTSSLERGRTVGVYVGHRLICLAKGGALLSPDGEQVTTPAEVICRLDRCA